MLNMLCRFRIANFTIDIFCSNFLIGIDIYRMLDIFVVLHIFYNLPCPPQDIIYNVLFSLSHICEYKEIYLKAVLLSFFFFFCFFGPHRQLGNLKQGEIVSWSNGGEKTWGENNRVHVFLVQS